MIKEFSLSDYQNVFRYLKISEPTEADKEICYSMFKILSLSANPKNTARVCDAKLECGYYSIPELGLNLKSKSLTKMFNNVEKIAVTASTLGAEVDKKIKYYSAVDIVKATFLDAVSSVIIENSLDELERELVKSYPCYNFSMRFSCGYGDLELSLQPDIIKALDATKILGITVNSAYLMSPSKSITSFIGLTKTKKGTDEHNNICEDCVLAGNCVTKCNKSASK